MISEHRGKNRVSGHFRQRILHLEETFAVAEWKAFRNQHLSPVEKQNREIVLVEDLNIEIK